MNDPFDERPADGCLAILVALCLAMSAISIAVILTVY